MHHRPPLLNNFDLAGGNTMQRAKWSPLGPKGLCRLLATPPQEHMLVHQLSITLRLRPIQVNVRQCGLTIPTALALPGLVIHRIRTSLPSLLRIQVVTHRVALAKCFLRLPPLSVNLPSNQPRDFPNPDTMILKLLLRVPESLRAPDRLPRILLIRVVNFQYFRPIQISPSIQSGPMHCQYIEMHRPITLHNRPFNLVCLRITSLDRLSDQGSHANRSLPARNQEGMRPSTSNLTPAIIQLAHRTGSC